VGDKYSNVSTKELVSNNEKIDIQIANNVENKKTSNTEQKSKKVLPLLFYWKWQHAHTCKLNSNIPLAKFSKTFNYYASSSVLKSKLEGKRVELTIENIPSTFTIYDNGWSALGIAGSKELIINPLKKKMVVRYKMYEGLTLKKTGVIAIANTDAPLEEFSSTSTKEMTLEYLDQYEKNLAKMTKSFADKLAEELYVYAPNTTASR
jgi:hypothetical protein